MEVKIHEIAVNEQSGNVDWKTLMTDEEYQKGQYYNNLYLTRLAEISAHKDEWERIEELCACQREPDADDPDYPNNFVPIITPVIEGVTASIIEGDIEFNHVTDNPAHNTQMVKYNGASEYARRKNHFIDHFKDYTRQYEKLGNSIMTISWEEGFSVVRGKPRGFPRLTVCPLLTVLIDGRIKDAKDLQYAEYIIHIIGFQSLSWAKKEYGKEKASAVARGFNLYDGENPDVSYDDQFSFTLLHVWTRDNEQGNLQLIEMTSDGFVLRMSDPSKPYYKYTENEYPFFISRMIPITGQFYGYGDGAILKYPQEYINNLADELELSCRFSAQPKVVVDPKAKMGIDQLNSNPAEVAVCPDPHNNILVIPGAGINQVVLQAIQFVRNFAPEAVRFSPIMTGNQSGVSATATQITGQLNQGSVGINDKKSDIARAMEQVDRYSLKMCMEYWDMPFWSMMGHNYQEHIDPAEMLRAPSAVPVGQETIEKARGFKGILGSIFGKSKVKNDLAKDKNGDLIYVDIDFDTMVYIGKGIAKDSTSLFNILTGLAGTMLTMPDGSRRMAITPKCYTENMEQLLGMKLKSEGEEEESLEGAFFDPTSTNGMNPIGNNQVIQKPQQVPANLMNTVPQMPDNDSRKVQI